jgi:translation initiation factor 3 subunit I
MVSVPPLLNPSINLINSRAMLDYLQQMILTLSLYVVCIANSSIGDQVPCHTPKLEISVDDRDKCVCLGWTAGDEAIIAGMDSGNIIKYDAVTGKELIRLTKAHKDRVNRLTFNNDKTLFVTASKDCDAKLFDPYTLTEIRTYHTDRPVNGAVISPTHPHIIMGGGQEAMTVTTTGADKGKFESRFFHMVYGEEFGRVKGHFGPINAIAIHPQGKSYASGSEDGFIRLHHFDKAYLDCPHLIPEEVLQKFNDSNENDSNE